MKKVILSAVLLAAFSSTDVLAQQQVKFGPKAGVNFANISGLDNSEMKTGFHVGAVAEIKFNEKFSIQPEVVYSTQGAKFTYNNAEVKLNNDYINVPIMAKYYIVDGFSVEAGPQVGFLAKAEQEGSYCGFTGTVDAKDRYKSVDFGLNFGLAYDLPMGFFVNARYNLGLSKVGEDYTIGNLTYEAANNKNSVIQLGVGYKFD